MNKETLKQHALIWTLLAAPLVYLLFVWNQLPDQITLHWNARGQADGFGPKNFLFGLFGLNVGIYLLLTFLPKIDPRRKNIELSAATYLKICIASTLFMSMVLLAAILSNQGIQVDVVKIILLGTLLLFAILGNYFSQFRPNYFIGIRTPWTLENDTVWRKTHQMAGKLWFWTAIALIPFVFWFESQVIVPIHLAATLILALAPVIYSYVVFGQIKRSDPGSFS
jgi:uncharacterized membrane protein